MKNKYALAIAVGVIVLIADQLLNALFGMIFPALNAEYASPFFKSGANPVNALLFISIMINGGFLTYLWLKTKKVWKSGFEFGAIVGIIMSVPLFLNNYSSLSLSMLMVGTWSLFFLVDALVAGLVLEKLDG
jgi:hypothetical protein